MFSFNNLGIEAICFTKESFFLKESEKKSVCFLSFYCTRRYKQIGYYPLHFMKSYTTII